MASQRPHRMSNWQGTPGRRSVQLYEKVLATPELPLKMSMMAQAKLAEISLPASPPTAVGDGPKHEPGRNPTMLKRLSIAAGEEFDRIFASDDEAKDAVEAS